MSTAPEYLERIYAELSQLAAQRFERESHDDSPDPIALINEVYLWIEKVEKIRNTNHFGTVAAGAV